MQLSRIAIVLLLVLAGRLAAADRAIDDAVRHARRTWNVPGVAVVIVRDDRVIYLQGHGVRAAGTNEAVTPDTLFALSSCSKAFTTAAMAMLVEEGKLSWDDPVRKHLPWFRLADPQVERQVQLRDLVCHRTGLGEHELLWYHAPWSAEEAVRRAGLLPLDAPFRSRLQYQSTLFNAAALAAAAAAGSSWVDLVRKRLLDPLAMRRTCLGTPEVQVEDVARPHRFDRVGEPAIIAAYRPPSLDPAIGVYSSARDLAAWLRFHLSGGMANGRRLVSRRALTETHTAQIVMHLSAAQKSFFPDTRQHSYAMGWAVHDHQGVRLVSHGGSIDGFRCHLVLAPEHGLGIAILANLERTPLPVVLANTLIDLQLGLKTRDWHALYRAGRTRLADEVAERQRRRLAGRQLGTSPSREAAAYVGDYEHPAYGTARIRLRDGRLVWRWRDEEALLEHFHHDTFALASALIDDPDLTFQLDRGRRVTAVAVTGKLNVVFRKMPPTEAWK